MQSFFKTSYPPIFFPIYYFDFIPLKQMVFLFFPRTVNHTRLFDFTLYNCFRYSSRLTFSGRHISLLYILPKLHWMEYTQFLVMLYSVGGLDSKEIFSKSQASLEYCPDIILTTYLLNLLDQDFDKEQTDCQIIQNNQGLFKVDPGAGSLPRHVRWLQKWSGP